MREEIYQQIRDHSFNLSLHMTKNYNDAEDIAQIVSIKYLLNENRVNQPIAWSSKVTKNEVYLRSRIIAKSETLLEKNKLEIFEDNLKEFLDETRNSEKKLSSEIIKQYLNADDFKVYTKLRKYDFNVSKMAKNMKLTYHAAHTCVYRMKRNLKSKILLKEGYTTSKDVIGYNTNKNIVKFIKIFFKKMKENNLKSLHSYLENIDIDKIQALDVLKVLDYDIKLKTNLVHELLIPYLNTSNQVKFCGIRFIVDKKKRIKVTEFISKPKEAIKINLSKRKLYARLPKITKGQIQASKKDIKQILDIE